MTGSFYVVLALAEATMSYLPTVGPAAARRSRTILHRMSTGRVALMGRVTACLPGIRAARERIEAAVASDTAPGETLSP